VIPKNPFPQKSPIPSKHTPLLTLTHSKSCAYTPTAAESPVTGGILDAMPAINVINLAIHASDIIFLEVKTVESAVFRSS
jgi:hypothetical protein